VRPVALVAFALVLTAAHARAQTCAAHADCQEGLRCLKGACVTEQTFDASRPRDSGLPTHEPLRWYLGAALGGGLPVWMVNYTAGVSAQASIRGGILIDHFQVQVDVSPVSTVVAGLSSTAYPMSELTGTVGYLIPISDMVSWMLRIGGGGGTIFNYQNSPYSYPGSSTYAAAGFVEFRADVVGAAIRTSRHLLVEFNGPSFRVLFLPDPRQSLIMWVTNVAINYVF
jgi:hypothetical protein